MAFTSFKSNKQVFSPSGSNSNLLPDVNPLKPVDPVLPLPLLKAPPVLPENEPPADEVAAFPNVLAPPLPNKPARKKKIREQNGMY